jgi:hypothetical protein
VKAEGYAEDSDEYKAAAAAADAAQKSLDAAKKAVSAADSQVKEAERQGVLSTSLPKIKISKPAAGKKSVTVKWKKLSTKNKKKADKIEVWVCPNKSFKASDTIMKTASKSKASLKIKKLKSKKKYYVKTRTIKYVNGVKTVSKWSTPKKFKVK